MNPTNHQPTRCPRCGRTIPTNAPEGLCPTCLGNLNLDEDTLVSQIDTEPAPGGNAPPLPTSEELAPHFPQLEILECLGRGGMGVVYKARQKSLDRIVALKLLAPERKKDPHFAERFAREAQALAKLDHPNIVTVHDFGEAGGFFFLLMEFVDGVTLRQAMAANKLTPEEALAVVPPICEALQFAHERGIVHRDIKPENLLMARDGRIVIADFGIARILDETGAADGGVVGTPRYMAPEQRSDPEHTDHRADIYSLGVVLYEMLTGEPPAERIVPPSRRVQVDVRLDEVVLRALDRSPELRFQTAEELRTRIEAVVDERGRGGSGDRERAPSSPAVARPPGTTGSPAVPGAPGWPALLGMVALALALALVLGREVARTDPLRFHFFGGGGWMKPTTYHLLAIGSAVAGAACLWAWWRRAWRAGGTPGWLPVAGAAWWIAAVVLLLGRKVARTDPLRFHFFGDGGWLPPGLYNFLVAACLLLGGLAFAAWWRLRSRGEPGAARASVAQPPVTGQGSSASGDGVRFSRTALVGACWAPLFFLTALASMIAVPVPVEAQGIQTSPSWWQWLLRWTLLPAGLTAPFGTTILGWVAVGQIRRSRGRLHGLGLALFDGLLFPLLVVDAIIVLVVWKVTGLVMLPPPGAGELSAAEAFLARAHVPVALLASLIACAVVDLLVAILAWRSARKPLTT